MRPFESRFLQLAVLTLASALLAGCGKTRAEFVKPFRPKFEALRKELAQMAAREPKEPVRLAAPLDPKPVLIEDNRDSNTAVFMFEQLTDPNVKLKDMGKLGDAYLGNHLLTPIQIAMMPDSELTTKGSETESKSLADALAVRYIGAIKILKYKPPVMLGTESFEIGNVKGIIMLFDRRRTEPVFAAGFVAQNDSQVPYSVKRDRPGDVADWLRSNLLGRMRDAAVKTLADGTGGTFQCRKW